MTFTEAMREIESHEFAARLNVASNFRTFLRAARQQRAVRILLNELDSPEKHQEVFFRVFELSRQQVDLRYENQWDTALAIYVWLISLKDPGLAKAAASVTTRAPQCWWAAKISRHILLEEQIRSDADIGQRDFTPPSHISPRVTPVAKAGQSVLLANLLSNMPERIVKFKNVTNLRSESAGPGTIQEWPAKRSALYTAHTQSIGGNLVAKRG
jgi:hypothetical protein